MFDYDTPRRSADIKQAPAIALGLIPTARTTAEYDGEFPVEIADGTPPELDADELTETVVPAQSDEFICTTCFLVHHRSRIANERADEIQCRDCR